MENNMGIQSIDKDGNPILIYKTPKYYYRNNPVYREKVKAMNLANYHKNRAERAERDNEKMKVHNKNKYAENPEYREKKKADSLARYYANKAKKAQVVSEQPPQ